MSWIAEYDTQGMEFPTCVHVTKTVGNMTHGATYVPIEDGKAVRIENAELRELVADIYKRFHGVVIENWSYSSDDFRMYKQRMRELGMEIE